METKKDFQEFKDKLASIATVRLYPIISWGKFTYIVLEQPKMQVAAQALDVIDITDAHEQVLRLGYGWPQAAYDEKNYALVIHPHEGWSTIVLMADKSEWKAYLASLPVQVVPPSRADAREVLEEIDAYDAAMIDAGSPLQIR